VDAGIERLAFTPASIRSAWRRWHGPWRRFTVARGLARLPGLGYQQCFVR
jgi:hypothetical protein